MERFIEFIKSIFAGIMISVGGVVYLSCENKYVGALLFCTGLISVVMLKFNLYTGRIGYVISNDKTFLLYTILSVLGNFVGCVIIGLMKSPCGSVVSICAAKLDKSYTTAFFDAILCGVLIYVCVEIYKRYGTVVGILFCIPTFILSGFEHSVADMFYFVNARFFSSDVVLFILVVILGNAIGSIIFHAGTLLFGKTELKKQELKTK